MKKQIITSAVISLVLIFSVFFSACSNMMNNNYPDNLKVVQEKVAGNTKVTILSKDGVIKSGSGSFQVEFRNASTNEKINVSNVSASTMMDMEGMTMMGEINMENMNMGHMMNNMMENCNMNYNMSMQGNWKCTINFNANQGSGNQSVEFSLTVI